jgi:HK97 family phage prohead protease
MWRTRFVWAILYDIIMGMAKEKLHCRLELKADSHKEDDDYAYFTGYGSVFGNVDEVNDIVEQGAFAETISEKKTIPMLWQHDWRQPIGLFKNLREDANGLHVEGEINKKTQKGLEAYSLLKQGAINGLSIGFTTKEYSYDTEKSIRRIKKINLFEISTVTFPANKLATATDVKCFVEKSTLNDMDIRDFEHFLRDALNCSSKTAKRLASGGYDAAIKDRDGLPEKQQCNAELLAIATAIKDFRVS